MLFDQRRQAAVATAPPGMVLTQGSGSSSGAQQGGAPTPARWDPRDDEHLARLWQLRPEAATVAGSTAGLSALGDASPAARTAVLEALLSWRRSLEAQANESRERMLDVRVFAASLELLRFSEAELVLHRHDADLATPIFAALLYHVRGHVPLETQRFEALAQRLRALGPALASGRVGVTAPSADLLVRAQDVLDGGPDLLRAIDEAAQKAQRSGAIDVALAADVHAATAQAGEALLDQDGWLRSLAATPHVPMGIGRLNELLRLRGLDLQASDVLDLARSLAEELRIEEIRTLKRGYKGVTGADALAQARRASPNSLGEALSWITELVHEARGFVANNGSVVLPDAETERLVIDAMPSVLAVSGENALALPPQPLAPVHETLLLLRESPGTAAEALPELSVADLENVTASHCYPGFHLQQVWAARTTSAARGGVPTAGLSTVAGTWGLDMVHGWAHASEEMMRELAFRQSPASRLVMIRRAIATALLAAVDVGLHIGRLTPESAAAFLVRRAGMRLPVARAHVRALLRAPSHGLSAFVGKIRIEQLRREAHKGWRDGYSEKRFTTMLMTSGPVPLAYLFERLSDPPTYVTDVPTLAFNDG